VPHPFFDATRRLVFAHRGGSGLAPENTIAAFDNGLALGADGLELDVHLSRDGRVVVHHDRTIDRTTDGRGELASLTAGELGRVDAGFQFRKGSSFPFRGQGLNVPTLDDVLRRYRDCRIIIELKVNSAGLAAAVTSAVHECDAIDRVCIGSFSRAVLKAVRRLEPAIATSAAREEVRWALYRSWARWPIARAPYGGYQVPETTNSTRVVSPRFVRYAHAAGLGVQVWTVDRPEDARRLLDWGVDALITDRPDIIVPAARNWISPS
jgi:glycerophosphoryl diester phosphodiesterase